MQLAFLVHSGFPESTSLHATSHVLLGQIASTALQRQIDQKADARQYNSKQKKLEPASTESWGLAALP